MKFLRTAYYICIVCLSSVALFFSGVIEPRLLIATVPMSLFLLFLPKIHSIIIAKNLKELSDIDFSQENAYEKLYTLKTEFEVKIKKAQEDIDFREKALISRTKNFDERLKLYEDKLKLQSQQTDIVLDEAQQKDNVGVADCEAETEELQDEVISDLEYNEPEDNEEEITLESILEKEYREEPEESEPEGEEVKEYIYMGMRAYTKHGISLSSQKFDTKEAAEHFADVFRHNYSSRVRVCEVVGGGYGVFADFVQEYLIKSNFSREHGGYIFANWKYEQRHNLPAPPPEHFIEKYPKIANVLMFGVVTWPVLAVVLLFEWLRGARLIPGDNVQKKVTVQELANMTGTEFENYVGRRLKGMGYTNVRVTQASSDFGADVIAVNSNGETVCIQCKHYSKPVGIKAVQEIYSAKQYYGCQKAMVITNSTYTQAAIDLANKTGVDLWANFR